MGETHVRVRLLALAVAMVASLSLASTAFGQAQIPCSGDIGGGKFNCQFYVEGDGHSGGSPVVDSAGNRVGFLHKGTNWVVCQQEGRRETSGAYFNKWWAYTLSDGNTWGWVNGVYASGGDNDGGFANVPNCNGSKGNPPGAGGGAPPPPPPPASNPAQVPCSPISGARFNCEFWVAGDGRSGGSPVVDSAGNRVGFLRKGTNWVVCQQAGRRETSGGYFNRWWAHTTADNNRTGWVNAVYASGGENDGSFANVPNCNGTKGSPPGGEGGAPPPPPPPTGDRAAAADRAVSWAESKIGTRQCSGEQPAWNKAFGFGCTVAWCGVFAYTALEQGGFALNKARMSYTENIYTDALAGANGLTVIPKEQAQRGDMILFYWGGRGRRVQHVGLVRGPVTNGQISTVEGNTDSPSRVGAHTFSINYSKIKAIVRVGNVRASAGGLRPYAAKDRSLRRKNDRRYGLKKGERPVDWGVGQKKPKKRKRTSRR
jgi:hypothetical protein